MFILEYINHTKENNKNGGDTSMKNLTEKEKVYYEKHLRQDIAAEFEEEKDSGNQPENPGRYHFTQDYNYPISSRKR